MLWGAVSGFRKGFLFMLFALLALVAGVLAGWLFMGELETMLRPHFKLNEKYLPYLSFLLLFATTLLVVRTVGALTKWALHKTILGWADRLAGAFLGALAGIWQIVVAVKITEIVHELDLPRAIAVVLIPIVIVFFLTLIFGAAALFVLGIRGGG